MRKDAITTDAAVRGAISRVRAKPRSKRRRIDYPVSGAKGLQLRVGSDGTATWAVRYTRQSDGRQQRVALGVYPDVGLSEARTRAEETRIAAKRGKDPAGEIKAEAAALKAEPTFRQLGEKWISAKGKTKTPRSLANDRSMLDRHIYSVLGDKKVGEITRRDITKLLDEVEAKPDARMGDGKKGGRRLTHLPNRVFELVRAIFRRAHKRGDIEHDPTYGAERPIEHEHPRERELSWKEIATVWKALGNAPVERRVVPKGMPRGKRVVSDDQVSMTMPVALALKLALVTAQRIGEVIGMKHDELELGGDAPVWTIGRDRTKNKKQAHRVPLSPLAVELIMQASALSKDSDWLFPNAEGDGHLHADVPTKAVARSRKAFGVPAFRVHDLRRTAATRMAEMGINPHNISLVLNHAHVQKGTITSKVYIRYQFDREKREALDAWAARLEGIVGHQKDVDNACQTGDGH